METATTNNKTASKVFSMLVENTGRHILDSGGAYGRHFERNQNLTLEACLSRPRAYIARGDYASVDVFHYIQDTADYTRLAELLDKNYEAYSAQSSDQHMEDVENWVESLGGTVTRWENTYNYNAPLSQDIQFALVDFEASELLARIGDPLTREELAELETLVYGGFTIALVQIHGGCDIRGGYTRPVVFEVSEMFGLVDYSLTCPSCDVTWSVSNEYITEAETGEEAKFDEADGCPKCTGDLTADAYNEH